LFANDPIKTSPSTAVRPTAAEATDVQPPAEAHHQIFVGYRWPPADIGQRRSLTATDPAELSAVVDAWHARETAGERYPYLFLAPSLAQDFTDRLANDFLGEWGFSDAQLGMRLDLTVPVWLCAQHRKEHKDNDAAGEKYCEESCEEYLNPALVDDPGLTAEERAENLKRLDTESEDAFSWIRDLRDGIGPLLGTVRELVTRWSQVKVERLLYEPDPVQFPSRGWFVLLLEPDGRWHSARGYRFYSSQEYQKLKSMAPLDWFRIWLTQYAQKHWPKALEDWRNQHDETIPSRLIPSLDELQSYVKRLGMTAMPKPPSVKEVSAQPERRGVRISEVELREAVKLVYNRARKRGVALNQREVRQQVRAAGGRGEDAKISKAWREYQADPDDG
jgi:hypothetical protein